MGQIHQGNWCGCLVTHVPERDKNACHAFKISAILTFFVGILRYIEVWMDRVGNFNLIHIKWCNGICNEGSCNITLQSGTSDNNNIRTYDAVADHWQRADSWNAIATQGKQFIIELHQRPDELQGVWTYWRRPIRDGNGFPLNGRTRQFPSVFNCSGDLIAVSKTQ